LTKKRVPRWGRECEVERERGEEEKITGGPEGENVR
jgi:hypothetical protein